MKILLLSSFVIPGASKFIDADKVSTGGWVSTMLKGLSDLNTYDLSIVMKSNVTEVKKFQIKDIIYYFIPQVGFTFPNG